MKTSGTKEECKAIEEQTLNAFQDEFIALCDKYEVQAIAIGTRPETEYFTGGSDEDSMCAGFLACHIKDPNLKEVSALREVYEKCQDIIMKISLKTAIKEFGAECKCGQCKKDEAKKE